LDFFFFFFFFGHKGRQASLLKGEGTQPKEYTQGGRDLWPSDTQPRF